MRIAGVLNQVWYGHMGHLHSLDWNYFSFASCDNNSQGIVIFLFGIAQYVPGSQIALSCSD